MHSVRSVSRLLAIVMNHSNCLGVTDYYCPEKVYLYLDILPIVSAWGACFFSLDTFNLCVLLFNLRPYLLLKSHF